MSKVFYFSLIALLSTVILAPLTAHHMSQSVSKHSAAFLLRDFRVLDLADVLSSLVTSLFFFGYRFWENVAWPIAATVVQSVYLGYACSVVFSFYENPVGFFESQEALWGKANTSAVYAQYQCCGFAVGEDRGGCVEQLPCARAIARAMATELFGAAAGHLLLAAVHIAAGCAFWATHALGGIEFDQPPQNQAASAVGGYVHIVDQER
jgi:hypothetical protein